MYVVSTGKENKIVNIIEKHMKYFMEKFSYLCLQQNNNYLSKIITIIAHKLNGWKDCRNNIATSSLKLRFCNFSLKYMTHLRCAQCPETVS